MSNCYEYFVSGMSLLGVIEHVPIAQRRVTVLARIEQAETVIASSLQQQTVSIKERGVSDCCVRPPPTTRQRPEQNWEPGDLGTAAGCAVSGDFFTSSATPQSN